MILISHQAKFQYPNSKKPALKSVTLEISKPGIYGLAGKTGEGKSTFLQAIAGKMDLTSGQILVHQEPVEGPSKRLTARTDLVKLVAQDPDLQEQISVEENIYRKLLFYQSAFRTKKVNYLLRYSGLEKFRKVLPKELSGGQRQLLGILCAMAEEPQLLLLDEPFSNLDHTSKNTILNYLKSVITELQITVLFVSHEASDLLSFCDYVYVLHQGEILEEAQPEPLFFEPKNEYSAALFGNYSVIKKGKKNIFVRPSRIKAGKKGKIKVTIANITFCGNYYEFEAQDSKKQVYYFHESTAKYSLGSIVYLDF